MLSGPETCSSSTTARNMDKMIFLAEVVEA